MRHRPRQDRDRVRQACVAAQAEGQSAMANALRQIDAVFGEAAAINAFKIKVERLLRLGPDHPALRARFAARAALLCGRSLDAAIVQVERWWRDERKAFQVASALGYGNRLSLEILDELRLVLRLMRFKRMDGEFHAVIGALIATAASDDSFHRREARAQRASKGDGLGAGAGILRGSRCARAPQDDDAALSVAAE